MSAPVNPADLSAAIAALSKVTDKSDRAWLDVLEALDRIIGNDVLADEIADWREWHGLDRGECLVCGSDCRGACDLRYEIERDFRSGVIL